jgi:hypothetical protein
MRRTSSTRTSKISGSATIETNDETGETELGTGLEAEIGGRNRTPPRRPPGGGIDLGKGLDLEKPRPPRSPLGIEIGQSPSGNLGIGVEVPIGISPFGARGGVSIDPATGKIRGGYGGLGIGKGPIKGSIDVGVDTPPGSEEFGCFKYVTFTLRPFSHTYGKDECTPKIPTPTPTPAPTRLNPAGLPPGIDGSVDAPEKPDFANGCLVWEWKQSTSIGYWDGNKITYSPYFYETPESQAKTGVRNNTSGFVASSVKYYVGDTLASSTTPGINYISINSGWVNYSPTSPLLFYYANRHIKTFVRPTGQNSWILLDEERTKIKSNCSPKSSAPSSSPSLPNPPPKKMNNDCCKINILLQLEILRMLGRQVVNGKLMPISNTKGFLGEESERVKTPIKDITRPERIKIKFNSIYELLAYSLQQANNLDTALDPQSYKPPIGYLQNPEYNRDTEQSLKSNTQRKTDKSGNKREFKINEDKEAKFSGFIQQQCYIFEAIKRLEYLFPIGELSDAKIAKDLLIPGAEGDIKIHNMIMAYEVQMQYLNAALGDPREILTVKDANPAIEGDQPIEVRSLSISDLLRQNIKFHIDTGGDVDALVNLVLRDFRTNLANRLDQIKTAEMVQALFEDSGMLEKQEYVDVHLEGDPYAGQWIKGQGFKANPDLEKKTEEATEKVLRETIKPTEQRVKVSRRSKDEKTDMRDLLRGLADFIQRLLSIPSAGDAATAIDKLVESAKFKVQTDMALIRQNVSKAAAASRSRTKKRKK